MSLLHSKGKPDSEGAYSDGALPPLGDWPPSDGETTESDDSAPLFGFELFRSYSGRLFDTVDVVMPSDGGGGHCLFEPLLIINHRYQIQGLIGPGTFSLIWSALDLVFSRSVAIKVINRAHFETVEAECILNRYLAETTDEGSKVIRMHDVFFHDDNLCLVFDLVVQNILSFLNYLDSDFVGLPIPLLKKVVRDALEGLATLHSRGIVHTALGPENVLATRPLFPYPPFPGDSEEAVFHCLEDDPFAVDFKVGNLGNSCHLAGPMSQFIQTRGYRPPEVLLGIPYDETADVWSCACMTFRLVTKRDLFDPTALEEQSEKGGAGRVLDALHLSMIERVLGAIPDDWARTGANYQSLYQDGELIAATFNKPQNVFELLMELHFPPAHADDLAEFLEPMLAILPSRRPRAAEMLKAPWLHRI
jgi:serine/threonine protein kinase